MPLPPGYILRHPTPDEASAVQAVFDASESADTGLERRHEADIAGEWMSPRCRIDDNWWVVTDAGGVVVAVCLVWPEVAGEVTADHYVHPAHRGRGLGEALLETIDARVAELPSRTPDGTVRRLIVWCEDMDAVRRAALERRGFAAVRQYYEMEIVLSGDPAAPHWPAGIVARRLRSGVDEPAVFEADQEAFADHHLFEPRDYDEWRLAHVDARESDVALWWLAWDEDELAGFVIPGRSGPDALIGDLAVRRRWRGRGVGRALLLAAFGTLRECGVSIVRLYVDAENVTGAVGVYESVGMHVARRFDVMQRPLA